MARIRTIKPEFWTDETITECSLPARLVFIGIWNFADDNGNIERSAKQIKMKVLPADAIDVEPYIQELLFLNLLYEYDVKNKKYLHVRGFTKHQKINRPSESKTPKYDHSLRTYPEFIEEDLHIHGGLTEDSLNIHGGLTEGREGKGREGKVLSSSSSSDKDIETTLPIDDQKPMKMMINDFRIKYQETFNKLMPGTLNHDADQLCREYPRETLESAFQITAQKGGASFAYLKAVLTNTPKGLNWDDVFKEQD